jgi:hypothetical protein
MNKYVHFNWLRFIFWCLGAALIFASFGITWQAVGLIVAIEMFNMISGEA